MMKPSCGHRQLLDFRAASHLCFDCEPSVLKPKNGCIVVAGVVRATKDEPRAVPFETFLQYPKRVAYCFLTEVYGVQDICRPDHVEPPDQLRRVGVGDIILDKDH